MLQKTIARINWKALIQPWQEMDWWLCGLPIALTMLGGIMIRSTERNYGLADWWQHWLTGGIGVVLMFALARMRYEILLQWHWIIYAVVNLTLLAVKVAGTVGLGAQRWLNIGGFYLQPSEFAKVGIIITIAALLHEQTAESLQSVLKTLAVASVPWLLVFLEPNLGTSLVFGSITMGMLYWGNANPGWLLLLIAPILSAILFNVLNTNWLIAVPLLWVLGLGAVAWKTMPWKNISAFAAVVINLISGKLGQVLWGLLKDYQKQRIILFFNPDLDPLGGGYHLIQSRIAIGAGGLWGKGLHQGTQTQLNFIPEQWTDFIFSAIGEELGFVGCMAVLVVFWMVCFRLVIIAQNAKENFGSLIAIGVLFMLVFQVVVNIGMTIGLSPVTGLPLPWLSYGRSALLSIYIAIGIAQSVTNYRQRFKLKT
jgi:rod shape determining protein RodA